MSNIIGLLDLHMHTTVSDGTDTPEEIFEKVKQLGLKLFSITDHDAIKGAATVRKLIVPGDPGFITGVEFSCKDEKGKYHILGYGYDIDALSINELVKKGHDMRMKKCVDRLNGLKERFGIELPEDECKKILALDNPGKPHIGLAMVRCGFTKTKEEAMEKYLDKMHFPNIYLHPEEAIQGILNAGGIPVLAHPPYGSGKELITGEDMNDRLKYLINFGLQGVEVYYSSFTPILEKEILEYARQYKLYVTGGSDYHGTNKSVVLGDTGMDISNGMPQGLERFLEEVNIYRVYDKV